MNIQVMLNPLNKNLSVLTAEKIRYICGILPDWAANQDFEELDAYRAFEKQYSFPIYTIDKGTIDDNGVYHYPEDPDLYPLIKMIRGDEVLYFYEHAIVGIVHRDNSRTVIRMD